MASTVESGAENLAQDPNAAQLVGREKEFVLTRAGAPECRWLGTTRLSARPAIEIDFHVAVPLNSSKMTSSMRLPVSIRAGGDDGERAAFFDVGAAAKEAAAGVQGVGINTAAEDFTGRPVVTAL